MDDSFNELMGYGKVVTFRAFNSQWLEVTRGSESPSSSSVLTFRAALISPTRIRNLMVSYAAPNKIP